MRHGDGRRVGGMRRLHVLALRRIRRCRGGGFYKCRPIKKLPAFQRKSMRTRAEELGQFGTGHAPKCDDKYSIVSTVNERKLRQINAVEHKATFNRCFYYLPKTIVTLMTSHSPTDFRDIPLRP
ncbi:MAG: hypothetical protein V4645_12035 [Pseudomonadota bacterium]